MEFSSPPDHEPTSNEREVRDVPLSPEKDASVVDAPVAPAAPEFWTVFIAKRSRISALFDIGATLLRELHTPGSRNFDATFPRPFSLTDGGPAYFEVQAVWVWVKSRQAIAANDPAGKSR